MRRAAAVFVFYGVALLWLVLGAFYWVVVRGLCIPHGWVWLSYYLSLAYGSRWGSDAKGGAVLAGAWALLRRIERPSDKISFLLIRLNAAKHIRGSSVAAAALIEAARGNLEDARRLMDSLSWFDTRCVTHGTRVAAASWRAADAAARGLWDEVVFAVEQAPPSPGLLLMGAVGRRFLGHHGAPDDRRLRTLFWLWPFGTRDLIERALQAQPVTEPVVAPVSDVALPEDPLGRAIALHARTLSLPAVSTADLVVLGQAWAVALLHVPQLRMLEDVSDTARRELVERLESSVVRDIVELCRAGRASLAQLPPPGSHARPLSENRADVLRRAGRELRDNHLRDLETVCHVLERRVEEKRALAAIDEWREFVSIRSLYEAGARTAGMAFRRLAWPTLHTQLCSFGVWLFNHRNERGMANAIFRFLLDEARLMEDQRSIDLQTGNVNAGI